MKLQSLLLKYGIDTDVAEFTALFKKNNIKQSEIGQGNLYNDLVDIIELYYDVDDISFDKTKTNKLLSLYGYLSNDEIIDRLSNISNYNLQPLKDDILVLIDRKYYNCFPNIQGTLNLDYNIKYSKSLELIGIINDNIQTVFNK